MTKLALILCDEIAAELHPKYNSYRSLFEKWLRDNSDDLDEEPLSLEAFNLFEEGQLPPLPSADSTISYDAVIISGSRSNVNDDSGNPWITRLADYLKKGWFSNLNNESSSSLLCPLIGICFGHQIIGKVAGVKVIDNPYNKQEGWSFGISSLQLETKQINIPSIHRQQLEQLPTDFHCWAKSEECPIEGMMKITPPIISVQGHPELTMSYIVEAATLRYRLGCLPKAAWEKAKEQGHYPVHSNVVAKIVLDFIKNFNKD